ncbi:hypothetical protein G9A89_021243 [Geosiphon pyriformis]|nr:hypothetical protein G9A89_021243 [Geosiphon pyriformis]
MPERVHDTGTGFDLRYPGKDVIKLKSHSCTCIDLKIALEIPATTIVQLAFQSSLVKREINIRGGIIDVGYVGNIIAMLQNDSKKTYIIQPNEKITQAIFLPLICQHHITNNLWMKRMLFVLTKTIGTNEHGKSRSTTTYAAQDIAQQFQ